MKTPIMTKPVDAPENKAQAGTCHGGPQVDITGKPLVAIVGNPNVGKSVLFNLLTGIYVTVSNYPGTTVEVSRGKGYLGDLEVGVVDTPGMYSLTPITEEERIARRILLEEHPAVVVHVVDAKNIERMLPMTLQLIDAALPVILVVNLVDEAERLGVQVDTDELERRLGIAVIPAALAYRRGEDKVRQAILARLDTSGEVANSLNRQVLLQYPEVIETAIERITDLLKGRYAVSSRMIAQMLLQGDAEVIDLVRQQEGERANRILEICGNLRAKFSQPLSFILARVQRETARELLAGVLKIPEKRHQTLNEKISRLMMNPWTGLPILALALFLLYEFVGVFGAQTLVDFLETSFETYINPWVDRLLLAIFPWQAIRDLFGGEFGIITLGVRYAVAIVLPIVGTFFFAFSIFEDSGYLPRLAMLIDRVFKRIGLNGRAVIPMVLGFGCDTMATIVTRTLETRRERILSTLLLGLAIPCSAQLGVMLGLMGENPLMLAIWVGVVSGVFLLVGLLAAKLLPGERPAFYMELPPLRMPKLTNILVKTYTRMEWYFREVFPLFILASVLIWFGKLTGLFDLLIKGMLPFMHWLGLPDDIAVAFLFGFFRRDYGAAGLFDLRNMLTNNQILVATVSMTLFVPCIAQFAVTIKERGWKTALGIFVFIFPFAFLVGGILNQLLNLLGVTL